MVDIFKNAQVLTAKQIMDRILSDFKRSIQQKRIKERQGILDRYTGKDITGVDRHDGVDSYFSTNTKQLVSVAAHNIIKRIVNRESQVYNEMPTISFPVPEGSGESVQPAELPENYNQIKRWHAFRKAERRTRLLGTGLLHPFWRGDKATGFLDWEYIYNYQVFTGDDPLVPIAVAYPIVQHIADTTHHEHDKHHDSRRWMFWSEKSHFLFDPDGKRFAPTEKNTKMKNPYGVLPFISVHPDYQDGEYWVESPQTDTVNVMDAINKGVTEGRLGIRFAMGQQVIEGEMDANWLGLGIDMLLTVPEGSSYHHEALKGDFAGIIDMIKFELQTMLTNHGQGAEFTDEGSSPASGFSLTIKNLPLLENRKDDLSLWRWYDKDTYDLEDIITKVETGKNLPDDRHIDYTEPKFPHTVEERIASENHDLGLGLVSVTDLAMKRDPDGFVSEKEALKSIEHNKEINSAAGFRGANEPPPTPSILLPTGQTRVGT